MMTMKTLIKQIVLCLAVICSTSFLLKANDFDKLFDKYALKEGVESVHITQTMLKMLAGNNKNADNFSGVQRILVLTVNTKVEPQFTMDMREYLDTHTGVEKISSVRTESNIVESYFYDGYKWSDQYNLFLMYKIEGKKETAIFIYGDFNIKNVTELPIMVK